MKKIRMTIAAAMFCAAAFAGYTAYEQATMTDAEKFMLANLEALTQTGNESSYGGWYEQNTVCNCGHDILSCMWDSEGNGGSCSPGICNNCGAKGSYFY